MTYIDLGLYAQGQLRVDLLQTEFNSFSCKKRTASRKRRCGLYMF